MVIRLGDARDYTRRHPHNPLRVEAINVDGLRSRPGDEFIRPIFAVLDDGVVYSTATWYHRPGPAIDESLWLKHGLITDAAGNRYDSDGGNI